MALAATMQFDRGSATGDCKGTRRPILPVNRENVPGRKTLPHPGPYIPLGEGELYADGLATTVDGVGSWSGCAIWKSLRFFILMLALIAYASICASETRAAVLWSDFGTTLAHNTGEGYDILNGAVK